MNKMEAGAVSGFVATVPMTAAMLLIQKMLPEHEQYSVPPSEITNNAAEKAGADEAQQPEKDPRGDKATHLAATTAAHFGFGTAIGALYGEVADHLPGPPAVRGMLYGMGVWAVNYLGLLPATGLLSPATEHPPGRNAMMIAAHLVWGATLGPMEAKLAD